MVRKQFLDHWIEAEQMDIWSSNVKRVNCLITYSPMLWSWQILSLEYLNRLLSYWHKDTRCNHVSLCGNKQVVALRTLGPPYCQVLFILFNLSTKGTNNWKDIPEQSYVVKDIYIYATLKTDLNFLAITHLLHIYCIHIHCCVLL